MSTLFLEMIVEVNFLVEEISMPSQFPLSQREVMVQPSMISVALGCNIILDPGGIETVQ